MSHQPVFLYIGAYAGEQDAEADYAEIKTLHGQGALGAYDAAVVVKGRDGSVTVRKDELPTRRGAWSGAGVGAVVGLLFPPALVASAAVGAAAGAVAGHLWRGLSRDDVRDLGNVLDAGEAALVVVGKVEVEPKLRPGTRALRCTEVRTSADTVRLQEELDRSAQEIARGANPGGISITVPGPDARR